MATSKFVLAQDGHLVQAQSPILTTAGWTSDAWSMENYAHASIVVSQGASGGEACTFTLYAAADSTGTSAAAIPSYRYYSETTALGDTLGTVAAASTAGVITTSTGVNTFYVIEIGAAELTDGLPWMYCTASTAVRDMAVWVVLSGSRYPQDQSLTAIA